jgi:hypothetical protein
MSDRPPSLARTPSDANLTSPPDAWCRACNGTRSWAERYQPKGWRFPTCHPPVHLPAEAIRREGEGHAPRSDAPPQFRHADVSLDEVE